MLQGAASFQQVATPDERLMDLLFGQPHRVEVGAMGARAGPSVTWRLGSLDLSIRRASIPGDPPCATVRRRLCDVSGLGACFPDRTRTDTRGPPRPTTRRTASNPLGSKRFLVVPKWPRFMAGSRRLSAAPGALR
jgi:hypothetical protein